MRTTEASDEGKAFKFKEGEEQDEIEQFVEYLRERLIPDLKDSGLLATAADFERCVEIIVGLTAMTDSMLEAGMAQALEEMDDEDDRDADEG